MEERVEVQNLLFLSHIRTASLILAVSRFAGGCSKGAPVCHKAQRPIRGGQAFKSPKEKTLSGDARLANSALDVAF